MNQDFDAEDREERDRLVASNRLFVRALLAHRDKGPPRLLPVRPDVAAGYSNAHFRKVVAEKTAGVWEMLRAMGHPVRIRELVPVFMARWGTTASTTRQYLNAILHNARRQAWVQFHRRYWSAGLTEAEVERYARGAVMAKKRGARAAWSLLRQNPFCPMTEPRLHAKWVQGIKGQLTGRINYRPQDQRARRARERKRNGATN